MFDFGEDPVRPALVRALRETWDELARPGSWWDASERAAIARVARAARAGAGADAEAIPASAADAAAVVAARPATATETWVTDVMAELGELRYVELVGVVARVAAVDTFLGLLGHEPEVLPDPVDGPPGQDPVPATARRNKTWVSMVTPVPPFVLGAVPPAMEAMNRLCEQLYMPPEEMEDPDWQRNALHRTSMELVATTVSHRNECFY